jgi:hypothetical protein
MRHQQNKCGDDKEDIQNIPPEDSEGLLEILDLVEAQYKLAKKHRDIWKKKLLKRTTKPQEEIHDGFDRKR